MTTLDEHTTKDPNKSIHKKFIYVTITLMLLMVNPIFTQTRDQLITGKVINEKDAPLSLASIQLSGTNLGTITNDDGEFVIQMQNNYSDTLIVYFIGYQTTKVVIPKNDTNILIILNKADIDLDELIVLDKKENAALKLIRKLTQKYRSINKEQSCKVFLNLYSKMDQPLEIFEAFYNARVSTKEGIRKLYLKNGRAGLVVNNDFAFVSINTTDIISDFSVFRKNYDQKLPLGPTNMGYLALMTNYDIKLDYILKDGDSRIAVILFEPKYANQYFGGKAYVDIDKLLLQKMSYEIKNTNRNFLRSLQDSISVDSLNISMEITYYQGNTNIQSIAYDYSFVLSNNPQNRISSRVLMALYDYDAPFDMPVSKPIYLNSDYQRILTYPFNNVFWENNYYIPKSKKRIDYTNYFKENGYLINHDSITVKSPYIESPYLNWQQDIRLTWNNLPIEEPIRRIDKEDGTMIINYQTSLSEGLRGHIFLDYEKSGDITHYTSRASIDRSSSYLKDLPRNAYMLIYLNFYFDLHEIHRRRLISELNTRGNIDKTEIKNVYDAQILELNEDIKNLMKETEKGSDIEAMEKWNLYIFEELKINNFELFGVPAVTVQELRIANE
jgi:carboxypeptidase-like protein